MVHYCDFSTIAIFQNVFCPDETIGDTQHHF